MRFLRTVLVGAIGVYGGVYCAQKYELPRIGGTANKQDPPPAVAVLRLAGRIADNRGQGAFVRLINYDSLSNHIESVFASPNLKAVCLKINSPGGSPVQSEIIAKRIQSLSTKKGVPVYAFIEDVGASGGYFLACGAEEIYVSESSIVGGIGVISQSFGLQEILKRWGLENRLQTSGDNKGDNNPFIERSETAVAQTQRRLTLIHDHFISFVKASRGDRLKGEESHLFSGECWTGKEALELGLVDGIETDAIAFSRAKFGENVQILMPKKPSLLGAIFNRDAGAKMAVGDVVGDVVVGDVVNQVLDQLEERLEETRWSVKFK